MKNLKQEFQQLKADYTNNKVERMDIIRKMQENLKKRTNLSIITGLDGKEYQMNSDNVEDLYAIDGALSALESSERITDTGNVLRKNMGLGNKYGPSNPYNGR